MKNVILSARPYRLYFEHRPDYLLAYVHCKTISLDIAKGYWVEILSLLHHRRYKRLLLEKDVPQRLAAHEVYELVSEIAHSGCGGLSIGIFDHNYIEERCRFEETVGTNRGLRLRILGDLPELENWLLKQPSGVSLNKNHFPHIRLDTAKSPMASATST